MYAQANRRCQLRYRLDRRTLAMGRRRWTLTAETTLTPDRLDIHGRRNHCKLRRFVLLTFPSSRCHKFCRWHHEPDDVYTYVEDGDG